MLGKPGSGKGTQTRFLAKETGFNTFSTGDKFRELQKADTPLGHRIADIMDNGHLMPYWFAGFLFQEAVIYLPQDTGIIYEGAARKVPEAELFHDVMGWLERSYKAIYLDISHEESMKRLLKRKDIEGRADDEESKIQTRLSVYEKEIKPTLDVFKNHGTFLEINGEQTPEQVFEEIMKKMEEE